MESNRLSAYSVYDYYYYLENDPAEIYIPALIIIAVMPLLALIFGVVSKKRGYRCGVSTAGVSTGIIGLAAVTIALIFAFASM